MEHLDWMICGAVVITLLIVIVWLALDNLAEVKAVREFHHRDVEFFRANNLKLHLEVTRLNDDNGGYKHPASGRFVTRGEYFKAVFA